MQKLIFLIVAIFTFTACAKSYNQEVELTADKKAEYEAVVAEYSGKITNFVPSEQPSDVETEEVIIGEEAVTLETQKALDKPPVDWFVEKARAEKKLGHVDEAIATLENVFNYYERSSVATHNLGKTYEDLGECEKAEEYYTIMIEDFKAPQYHYDIAHCYLYHDRQFEKINQHYALNLQAGGRKDSEIETYLTEEITKQLGEAL